MYLSTALIPPLTDVGLLHTTPAFAILGLPHPAGASCHPKAKIIITGVIFIELI